MKHIGGLFFFQAGRRKHISFGELYGEWVMLEATSYKKLVKLSIAKAKELRAAK